MRVYVTDIAYSMAQLALVPAPRGFSPIWTVMKPWLAKETASKIAIYGSDYKKALLELIDPEALPTSLGGTCTCDGAGGCMKSNAGPWMHERARRREAWLNGERDTMALLPGELTGELRIGKKAAAQVSEEPSQQEAQVTEGEQLPADATETSLPSLPSQASGSTSEASSISTPSTQSREASVERMYKEHPETRDIQTGDLHSTATVVTA